MSRTLPRGKVGRTPFRRIGQLFLSDHLVPSGRGPSALRATQKARRLPGIMASRSRPGLKIMVPGKPHRFDSRGCLCYVPRGYA